MGKSDFEALGGAGTVRAAVAVLYQRVLDDADLRAWFEGIDLDRLRSHQRAFLTAALGGPDLFGGRSLAEAHAGLEITDEAFDGVLEHLVLTLHDLAAEDDVVAQVRSTVEGLRRSVVSAPEAR